MKQIFILLLFSFLTPLTAQYNHEAVHPELSGDALFEVVTSDFTPQVVLPYGPARDTLYGRIDVKNDSVECVYTGLKLYLDPSLDPTQALFLDGKDNGINTEHTYPQSKGAANGNARSDMHHLFPTRTKTNNDRGSLPFGEIPDSQTDIWYFMTMEQGSIPANNIEAFSEITDAFFEPRESHKGDVARAMMYFYTMYRNEALSADPDYFIQQEETLCDWHYQDPVDQKEWERNMSIASYQDGKPNPFILDCTLAARLYCQDASEACQLTGTETAILPEVLVYPNPAYDRLNIYFENEIGRFSVFNYMGQKIEESNAIQSSFQLNIANWPEGMYFIHIKNEKSREGRLIRFIKH